MRRKDELQGCKRCITNEEVLERCVREDKFGFHGQEGELAWCGDSKVADLYPRGSVQWVTHQFGNAVQGCDMSFMERICAEDKTSRGVWWHHIDSWYQEHDSYPGGCYRFQGIFYHKLGKYGVSATEGGNCPPIPILKYATRYQMNHSGEYVSWTIWFAGDDIKRFL